MLKRPQQDWIMDFITKFLPSTQKSSVYNTVFIVVNHYTKYIRYIPARKDWNAKLFANIMVKKVFIKFKMLRLITNDQNSFFKSNFWSNFCYYIKVQLGYSTAFHLQTNDQTKYQNQILEQYLKIYINYQQDNWVWWLLFTKFAYNNALYVTMGKSLFQEIFGKPVY